MLRRNIMNSILFIIACLLPGYVVAAELGNDVSVNGKYLRLQSANEKLFTVYAAGPKDAKQGILLLPGWKGLNAEVEVRGKGLSCHGR